MRHREFFVNDKIASKETETNVSLSNHNLADSLDDTRSHKIWGLFHSKRPQHHSIQGQGTEQHEPLLYTTTVVNSMQKQLPTPTTNK